MKILIVKKIHIRQTVKRWIQKSRVCFFFLTEGVPAGVAVLLSKKFSYIQDHNFLAMDKNHVELQLDLPTGSWSGLTVTSPVLADHGLGGESLAQDFPLFFLFLT